MLSQNRGAKDTHSHLEQVRHAALCSGHQQLNGENPSLTATTQTFSMITNSCDVSCHWADLFIQLLTLNSCWCVFMASNVKDWFIYFIVQCTWGHGRAFPTACFHLIFKTWKSYDILVCRMQPAAFHFNCSTYFTTPVRAAPLHTVEATLIIQISGDTDKISLIHS